MLAGHITSRGRPCVRQREHLQPGLALIIWVCFREKLSSVSVSTSNRWGGGEKQSCSMEAVGGGRRELGLSARALAMYSSSGPGRRALHSGKFRVFQWVLELPSKKPV